MSELGKLVGILRPGAVLLGFFALLTGVVYPLAVTGLVQVIFPGQANGSLVERGGRPPAVECSRFVSAGVGRRPARGA